MTFIRWKNWRAYVALLALAAWCIPMLPFIVLDLLSKMFGWLSDACLDAGEWLAGFEWADRLYVAFNRRMDAVGAWVARGD